MYDAGNPSIVCDMHPDYISRKFAANSEDQALEVQHHVAHIASCRAENGVEGTALGVAFDGTGFGPDGTLWGGEFFITDDDSIRHIAQFRQFPLPGGETAIREPRRAAIGMLYEMYADAIFEKNKGSIPVNIYGEIFGFNENEYCILQRMLGLSINSPRTSSVGRIFDGVSSLLGLKQTVSFEAQAAMALEFAASEIETGHYGFRIKGKDKYIIDWQWMIEGILRDRIEGVSNAVISSKFHNTLCEIVFAIAQMTDIHTVILSGGCFQNAVLLNRLITRLSDGGFKVYRHQLVPTNDGGISLGQIAALGLKKIEF